MRSTTELRRVWAPPCGRRLRTVMFWTGVVVQVAEETVDAWVALDAVLRKWGYEPRKGQTWGYNCRRITGGSGYSLHAYGIAVDINSIANPYGDRLVTDMPRGMVDEITAIRTHGGHRVFRWGGDWDGHPDTGHNVYDAMHFEVVASPDELATGIRRVEEGSLLLWT